MRAFFLQLLVLLNSAALALPCGWCSLCLLPAARALPGEVVFGQAWLCRSIRAVEIVLGAGVCA